MGEAAPRSGRGPGSPDCSRSDEDQESGGRDADSMSAPRRPEERDAQPLREESA